MNFADEYVKPHTNQLSTLQWVGAGLVLGLFFGFVDTLLIAAALGTVGITVSAYFGVPTTLTGYFFAGLLLGKWAPKHVEKGPIVGIVLFVWLFMWGFVGLRGHGALGFLGYFLLIPAVAAGLCYVGLHLGRGDLSAIVRKLTGKGL